VLVRVACAPPVSFVLVPVLDEVLVGGEEGFVPVVVVGWVVVPEGV
jgi:hypothetical protein